MPPHPPADGQTVPDSPPPKQGAESSPNPSERPSTDLPSPDQLTAAWPESVRPPDHGNSSFPHISGFEIQGKLGRGGMGIVYRARDLKLGRTVAIKTLRSGADAHHDELARFQKEAQVIAQLRHPHVVQVYEVGEAGGLIYLVLEFMNGGALSTYLDGGALEPTVAASIVKTLCDGAAAAHHLGIVHRDLKPSNVLISLPAAIVTANLRMDASLLQEPGVIVKLADFGLAKTIGDDSQTMTGAMMGTPRYAAPEQLGNHSQSISAATDVYALGAILYELLTGTAVFRSADLMRLLDMIRQDEPVPPRTLQPKLDYDLETICLKCLQKNPSERYATAEELGNELGRWLRREPIHARPAGAVERGVKWMRRNPGGTAFAGVSLIAAIAMVALIVSTVFQSQLSRSNLELSATRTELKKKNDELKLQNSALERAKSAALSAEAETARQRDLLARHRYAGDMLAAEAAWRTGDIARVEALLARNVPSAAAADLRGFEWHYLKGLLQSDEARMPGTCAVYSPDGSILAVSCEGRVELLDANTRAVIHELKGANSVVMSLAFSHDGKRLIGGTNTAPQCVVWDVADGKLVGTFSGHTWVRHVALSPDGSLAITTGFADDRTAKMWRVETGEILFDWPVDNNFLYAGEAAFSHDGIWYAVGWPPDKSIRIGKTASPAEYIEVALPSFGSPLLFDNHSKRLFASRLEQVVWLNLENLTAQSEFVTTKIGGNICDISGDGRLIATTVAGERSLRIWDLSSSTFVNERKGPAGGFNAFSFRGSTGYGVSSARDSVLRFGDVLERQEYRRVLGYPTYSRAVRFSPNGQMLAVVNQNSAIVLCDANGLNGRELDSPVLGAWNIEFSPDGQLVAAVGFSGVCRWWRVSDGKVVHEIVDPKDRAFYSLAFDAEGKRFALGGREGSVTLWDVAEKKELPEQGVGAGDILATCFRPGSDELATCGDGLVFFTGKQSKRTWNAMSTKDLLFTPDGSGVFIAKNPPHEVYLCEADTGKVRMTFSGHQSIVTKFAQNADGSRLATASTDGTVKIWDVASGQETFSISVFSPQAISMSPDGRKLAIASLQGEVRLYDATRGYEVAE
jgi:WD40 repeat protein